MDRSDRNRSNETEEHAITRRLVERSGLSQAQAQDAVEAYMHAEGGVIRDGAPPKIVQIDASR